MHLKNKNNEFARLLGDLLDKAPKTVIAAIAVDLLQCQNLAHEFTPEQIQKQFLEEWTILFDNGIVPQKPPKV